MSTKVDYVTPKLFLHVETVRKMSTEVDTRSFIIDLILKL